MRKGISIIVVGMIIGVLGILFHLQGHSVVGPESSFMYSNPDWVTYGIQIAIIGLIVIGVGTVITILKKD